MNEPHPDPAFDITFSLQNQGCGWLRVVLRTPLFECECGASNVPHDCVGALADALLHLLIYPWQAVMVFDDEPEQHEFRFVREGPESREAHLEVWRFPDDGRSRRAQLAGVHIGSVTTRVPQMIEPFLRALRRLGDDPDFRTQWNRDFPADTLARITRELAEQASLRRRS